MEQGQEGEAHSRSHQKVGPQKGHPPVAQPVRHPPCPGPEEEELDRAEEEKPPMPRGEIPSVPRRKAKATVVPRVWRK